MEPKKFLKNESLFINKINEYYNQKDFEKVSSFKDDVFNNLSFYKETDCLEKIIISLFVCKYFTEVVTFVEELRKNEIEDMTYSFYLLASLIGEDDIFMAKSYLKRSKLMNSNIVKAYIEEDGANYSNILNCDDVNNIPCLLLINYINEYEKEGITNEAGFKEKDMRIYKYFEMIDNIYNFGYDESIVSFMSSIGRILFEK